MLNFSYKMRRDSKISLGKKLKSPLVGKVVCEEQQELKDRCSPLLKEEGEKKKISKETKQALKKLNKMSNDELELLLDSDDDFVIDCILDSVPVINKLKRERDSLAKQVSDLAKFNYAREPEFVRDRLHLRETLDDVAVLSRRLTSRHILPVLEKLKKAQEDITQSTRNDEEESEKIAQEFLHGLRSYDEFLESYIDVRKEASRRRSIADKLSKESSKLESNLPKPVASYSPVPMPRRKRVSINI